MNGLDVACFDVFACFFVFCFSFLFEPRALPGAEISAIELMPARYFGAVRRFRSYRYMVYTAGVEEKLIVPVGERISGALYGGCDARKNILYLLCCNVVLWLGVGCA